MGNGKFKNNSRESKESTRGGKGRDNRQGPRNNHRQNHQDGERRFQKFVDTDHVNNESKYWPQSDWNSDNSRNNNYNNGRVAGAGIYSWIREHPVNPLILPQHTNFEQQCGSEYQEVPSNNKDVREQNVESVKRASIPQEINKEISVSRSENNSVSAANHFSADTKTSKLHSETNFTVKIKQEKEVIQNLKQRKSSSSSSSSSSDSSSSEEPEPKRNPVTNVKSEVPASAKPASSFLNIKLKPKANSANSASINPTQNLKAASSKSSSSSDEKSEPPTPSKPPAKADKMEKLQAVKKDIKIKSTKNKNSSEDDVVCIEKLENKIVLEDDSEKDVDGEEDEETVESTLHKLSKKSLKKTAEKCMICNKKGHTSFQCQMICKNCNAPYHGYRTCPHPANLNTMLQLFLEFCLQQFQSFSAENLYDCPHFKSGSNKSNKLKRKQAKANESNAKNKASKKRKISTAKKIKSKTDNDSSSDDESNEDDTDSEKISTKSEETSSDSSSAESLISSKKKRKMKIKNASKASLNLSNFSANPVSLPIVLNGFPNITVPTASVQNASTSTNALNTLLLTQMFQNAIDSLKK